MTPLDRWLRRAIYGLSASLIFLSLIGGWLWYSPVPYLDMWDGTVGFLLRSDGFPPNGLFDQQNEHRIALSRLLFWIDYNLFGGRHIFLMVFNYACAGTAWWVFWLCLKDLNSDRVATKDLNLVGMIVGAWVFLWSQSENFTWAFQSQFFLTQLLPLGAFLFIGRAAYGDARKNLFFGMSVLMGSASAVAMANGVLALPLMTVWAALLRLPIWRVLNLALVSMVVLNLYFTDYENPSHHSTLLESLLNHPLDMLVFTFRYVASPFAHVISPFPPASYILVLLGLTLTAFTIIKSCAYLKKPPENYISSGLLLFIVYIGATAFVTAGGRLFMSDYNAFASRYTTPAILAWTAAFCIVSPWVFRLFYGSKTNRLRIMCFAVLGLTALFIPIFRTLIPEKNHHFNQSISMLALELGIDDPKQIGFIYPNSTPVLIIANNASASDFGIFGRAPYRGLRDQLGQTVDPSQIGECVSPQFDTPTKLERAPNFIRVSGKISQLGRSARTALVLMLDETDGVLGAGLLNHPRSARDSSGALGRAAEFVAYLETTSLEQPLTFVSEACR